ncbi:MAG: L-fuconolactonase [Rhodothermales bacterium]|jgi:L-fuconolactonase
MPRIDSHQHFWNYSAEQYPWISDAMSILRCDHLPADLRAEQTPLDFAGSVAVQARQTVDESRWLLELAAGDDVVKGVVGWVDLRSDSLSAELDELAPQAKFVGVRHVVQDEPDDNFVLRPKFMRGIGALAARGLTYDLLTFPKQLPASIALVKAFPDQPFVLDHISKPLIADGTISPWDAQIRELAACENVMCKVSGMVTEAKWDDWTTATFAPYLDVVFEAFGPERIMIGSDWPVCRVAGNYQDSMNVVIDYIAQASADEQDAILGGNAIRFYGL